MLDVQPPLTTIPTMRPRKGVRCLSINCLPFTTRTLIGYWPRPACLLTCIPTRRVMPGQRRKASYRVQQLHRINLPFPPPQIREGMAYNCTKGSACACACTWTPCRGFPDRQDDEMANIRSPVWQLCRITAPAAKVSRNGGIQPRALSFLFPRSTEVAMVKIAGKTSTNVRGRQHLHRKGHKSCHVFRKTRKLLGPTCTAGQDT